MCSEPWSGKGPHCTGCKAENLARYYRKRERYLLVANDRKRALKLEVFEAYGGAFCRCCGETHIKFLAVDHVNDDGAERRRKGEGVGHESYRWLKKQGFPPDRQVLCMNCNWAKSRGGCPHEAERRAAGYTSGKETTTGGPPVSSSPDLHP